MDEIVELARGDGGALLTWRELSRMRVRMRLQRAPKSRTERGGSSEDDSRASFEEIARESESPTVAAAV